ncbi:MAG: hypothetical protein R2804_19075 [Cyclobacteriaceae bacterium]|jgi:hypothetical protein
MKNYKIYSMLCTLLLLIVMACSDEFVGNSPNFNDHVGAVTKVTVNPTKNFFNLNAALATAEVEFSVDVDGFGITTVNSVEVELVYTDKDRLYDPFREEKYDSVHSAVTLMTLSSFPSTVVVTGADVAAALGIPIDSLDVGDSFQITLPINTADGRRLTTALDSDLCNEPAQPSFGGCGVAWAISCPSDLGAEYSYVTTNIACANCSASDPGAAACGASISGTGSWTDLGSGVYSVSDATFGQYGCAWGDTEAEGVQITDVCSKIGSGPQGGSDQYGLLYTFIITDNTGTTLTIDWSNDYGDSGTTVLTRTDGGSWPLALSN